MQRKYVFITIAILVLICAAIAWKTRQSNMLTDRGNDEAGTAPAGAPAKRPSSVPTPGMSRIEDAGLHWEERIAAVKELPEELGSGTVKALFDILNDSSGQSTRDWYVVCNEIMDLLRRRHLPPGSYSDAMVSLIASEKSDPIIRDYAVQHLAQWVSGIDADWKENEPEMIAMALDAMVLEAVDVENAEITLPGTTFNALADAVLNGNGEVRTKEREIGNAALEVAANPSFASFNRTSALQAASRLEAEGVAELCRTFLQDNTVSPDLRLSSVAALGLVGSNMDFSLLEKMRDDSQFKFAALAAIERLRSKSN